MPSNERSAEWLRGAVESHINTCNLITSITSATESHPARQGLMAANNELHNQLDRYRALLAAAEAREAGENQALPLAELQRKHGELACELLSAAAVIEAAEKALETGVCYLRIYENENKHRYNWEGSEDKGTLHTDQDELAAAAALCARWKEANGA